MADVATRSMSEHDQRILHSSEDPNWRTQPACYAALRREFQFDWDFAADERSCLVHRGGNFGGVEPYYYGPGSRFGEDALTVDWPQAIGFLNPPFSRTLAAKLKRAGNPAHKSYRIENWAKKCWEESQRGCTIVGLFPFAPQTDWYRRYVMGMDLDRAGGCSAESWSGHAAREERRLPHRLSFLRADGSPAANAGVNTAIIVWTPNYGIVGPWQPHSYYWSFR